MSKIEWTDKTWNPITGCTKISAGCANCYAERMSKRLAGLGGYPKKDPFRPGLEHPKQWLKPCKWKKPRLIFVCSMGDLFHKDVSFDLVHKVLAVAINEPRHTFILLTKRPERMYEFITHYRHDGHHVFSDRVTPYNPSRNKQAYLLLDHKQDWPLANLWLGGSAENQAALDARAPYVISTPSALWFMSLEPLIGPIDLRPRPNPDTCIVCGEGPDAPHNHPFGYRNRGLDWIIVGGETGPGARPMHPEWVRKIRDQCAQAGIPFFFKSWGEYGPSGVDLQTGEPTFRMFQNKAQWVNKARTWMLPGDICLDMTGRILRKGADFDGARYPVAIMRKMGKKAAGNLLDGQVWDQFPDHYRELEERR